MKQHWRKLKGVTILPAILTVVLIAFSTLIGWNLFTLILFWIVLTPTLVIYLPKMLSPGKNNWVHSILSMTMFYALMVLMIYEHYASDYFQFMMFSYVFNFFIVALIALSAKQRRPSYDIKGNS